MCESFAGIFLRELTRKGAWGKLRGSKPAHQTKLCRESKRAVKPRASRLAESSRGRASRSRRKSDAATVL